MMYTPVWFVRRIPLPATVEGVTIPNDDGTFDIYINESLPQERQEDALRHELRHITKDHLYDDISPVEQLEREADTRDSLLNNHVRTIPLISNKRIKKRPPRCYQHRSGLRDPTIYQDTPHDRIRGSISPSIVTHGEPNYKEEFSWRSKKDLLPISAVNGKRVYLSAGSKEELEKKILQAQIERNAGVDISDVTTFAEYADLWLRVYKSPPKIRESSHKIVAANLRNHVLPFFGDMRLREIKPMHIRMFLTSLGDTSKSLQAKCFQIVKGVLASAADNGLIAKSPVSSTDKAGGRPTKEMKPLTAKQSKELLENLEGKRPYAFVLIALSTGMRRGEILGLMWEDVDLDSNLIHVRHNLTFPCDSNHAAVSTVLKTTSSRRDVPITPALKEFLLNEERTSPYVIHMQDGEVLSKSSFRAMWRTVNAARPSGVEDCHPHLLRHTFTTRCISSGMDPTSVQHLLGHKDLSVTMGIYNHYLEEERHENTVQLLHGALAYLC